MKRRKIDFSDIPELSDEQLAGMRRVGRPPRGGRPKKLISIRLDQRVLAWVKTVASENDQPYQALINDILEREMRKAG
ncbi:MAG: BrnA antitoxin family protein [Candidatus Binatia bacterium]